MIERWREQVSCENTFSNSRSWRAQKAGWIWRKRQAEWCAWMWMEWNATTCRRVLGSLARCVRVCVCACDVAWAYLSGVLARALCMCVYSVCVHVIMYVPWCTKCTHPPYFSPLPLSDWRIRDNHTHGTHTHTWNAMPDLISKFSFKSFYMSSRPHTFSCFCSCSRSPSLYLSFSFAPSLDLSVSISFSASNSLSRACVLSLCISCSLPHSRLRALAPTLYRCVVCSLSLSLSLSLVFFLVRSFFLSCALSFTHTHSFALAPLLSNTQSPSKSPSFAARFLSYVFSPLRACVLPLFTHAY